MRFKREPMETEKSCKNCAYFRRYYTLVITRYRPTESGFCGNSYVREATFQKNYPTACKRWEQSTKRERVLGRIRSVLLETAENMRHIADILENDKQLYGRTSLLPDQESTEILTTQVSESALGEKDSAGKSSAE